VHRRHVGMHVVPLRWLTIFGVAIETAGSRSTLPASVKSALRPHALIPNVRKLEAPGALPLALSRQGTRILKQPSLGPQIK